MSTDEPTTTEKERAEAEVHERAVLLGELVDGAVREGADEVEVADEWPRPRTRRDVGLSLGRMIAASSMARRRINNDGNSIDAE
jgi:hypothetical protein